MILTESGNPLADGRREMNDCLTLTDDDCEMDMRFGTRWFVIDVSVKDVLGSETQ